MPETISPDSLRAAFARRLSDLYAAEVPQYAALVKLVEQVNREALHEAGDKRAEDTTYISAISEQRHGAIRVGTAGELQQLRRLFELMGMQPVGFYDLVPAGLPVFSTAFRPATREQIEAAPFRIFCSLLRTDLIEDEAVRGHVEASLAGRQILSDELLALIAVAEASGGVAVDDVEPFLGLAIDVFRWSGESQVSRKMYEQMLGTHRLIADIAAFPGPHINHLTPSALDIDRLQKNLPGAGLEAKAVIEGPPPRHCPLLLRQTAFNAVAEAVRFSDGGALGAHTARFGEVEQRGAALTRTGREHYDTCLDAAREPAPKHATDPFLAFPDNWQDLFAQNLIYCRFSVSSDTRLAELREYDLSRHEGRIEAVAAGLLEVEPIRYEDFLPVSAAGIFRSNLGDDRGEAWSGTSSQSTFEAALGCAVLDPHALYEAEQAQSLAAIADWQAGLN